MIRSACIFLVLGGVFGAALPAQAQTAAAAKPKATAAPAKPASQTPVDTAKSLASPERMAIQSDLAWAGHYNGAINGEASERLINAIKAYQKDHGGKETGVLNVQERAELAAAARKAQDAVGWKIVTDMVTGARVGLPSKIVPQQASDANGTRWTSAQGTVAINLARNKEANATTATIAEREKKQSARKIDYSVVRPEFFVLSGLQGLKKFYLRGEVKGDEVRVLTVLYDQATEGTMEPVVIAMSSAFAAFPGAGGQALAPPRKTVEYGTGTVVSADGAVMTDRQLVDGCLTIAVPGYGHAERVAEDKTLDIALLRIYGARNLKPLPLGAVTSRTEVTITGIADPQAQGGGAITTTVPARLSETGLTPTPPFGFAGAPALTNDGGFAGLVVLKAAVVAGLATPAPAAQAGLVPGDAVREFLKTQNVTPASGATPSKDVKASVLRLVCVRK
jgi:peptidoglycan hydrolase-like protein with peptidoglycan-binding domain